MASYNPAEFYESYLLDYLHTREFNYVVKAESLIRNDPRRNDLRTQLIDLFILVSHRLELSQGTLYHSVNLIDRSLSKNGNLYGCIQLLGATCLYVAAKFEETLPLDIRQMLTLVPDLFDKSDIFNMEKELLVLHNLDVHGIDPLTFMSRITHFCGHGEDPQFQEIVCLLYDTLLPYYSYSAFRTSLVSASAVCGALCLYGEAWTRGLEHKTRYGAGQVCGLAKIMLVNVYHMKAEDRVPALTGVRIKYSCRKNHMDIINSDRFQETNILSAIEMTSKHIDFFNLS